MFELAEIPEEETGYEVKPVEKETWLSTSIFPLFNLKFAEE